MNYTRKLPNGNVSKRALRPDEFWFDLTCVLILGTMALLVLYWL